VRSFLAAILFLAITRIGVAAQGTALQVDPQHTTINFTLGDVLHTVRALSTEGRSAPAFCRIK
jgi:hypothetical protein